MSKYEIVNAAVEPFLKGGRDTNVMEPSGSKQVGTSSGPQDPPDDPPPPPPE